MLVMSGLSADGMLPAIGICFNLAIERLVISGETYNGRVTTYESFNLAIEMLFRSVPVWRATRESKISSFQSRNRDAFQVSVAGCVRG